MNKQKEQKILKAIKEMLFDIEEVMGNFSESTMKSILKDDLNKIVEIIKGE